MALKLILKPGERVIIGGAVIRNGSTRVHLMIENNVPILRESDILKPEFVRTPCERMYLALQLAYIDESRQAQHLEAYRELAADVAKAAPSCRPLIRQVTKALADGENYRALKCAARLREHERELLTHVQ